MFEGLGLRAVEAMVALAEARLEVAVLEVFLEVFLALLVFDLAAVDLVALAVAFFDAFFLGEAVVLFAAMILVSNGPTGPAGVLRSDARLANHQWGQPAMGAQDRSPECSQRD